MDVEDLALQDDGLVVSIRHSKTDQEREGIKVGIPYGSDPATCPVHDVQLWLSSSGLKSGAVFRSVNRYGRLSSGRLSDKSVALIVKRYVKLIGKDAWQFAGHSLRAGLATSAAMAGASDRSIMNQTGHRSVATLRRYIRDGSFFLDNVMSKTGL